MISKGWHIVKWMQMIISICYLWQSWHFIFQTSVYQLCGDDAFWGFDRIVSLLAWRHLGSEPSARQQRWPSPLAVYLAQQRQSCRRSSSSSVQIQVQVQTVEPMSPQEPDGGLDEGATVVWRGRHGGEPARGGKPSSRCIYSIVTANLYISYAYSRHKTQKQIAE